MFYQNKKKGIIQIIIIVIIGIIILSYFGFDLQSIVESPQSQGNLGYVWSLVVSFWDNYIKEPVLYLWNDIFIDLFWETFVSNFERIKSGEPTDFDLNTPYVNP